MLTFKRPLVGKPAILSSFVYSTMTTVANSFKGYQYYEFALLKDLTPESRKLAEQTSQIFDIEEE